MKNAIKIIIEKLKASLGETIEDNDEGEKIL